MMKTDIECVGYFPIRVEDTMWFDSHLLCAFVIYGAEATLNIIAFLVRFVVPLE